MKMLRGAAAGFAATVPMTLAMEVLRATMTREHHRRMPPREIVDRSVHAAGAADEDDRSDRIVLATIAHFAFGALAGAIYGATIGSRQSSALKGIGYGIGVWAVAYGVGLPSLGLHPSASDDTAERNVTLVASHVVWGATLGTLA
jgi:putative membrane protein